MTLQVSCSISARLVKVTNDGRIFWRQFGDLRLLQGSEYNRGLGGVGLQLLSRQHLTHLESALSKVYGAIFNFPKFTVQAST